jgi:hypothetical protein
VSSSFRKVIFTYILAETPVTVSRQTGYPEVIHPGNVRIEFQREVLEF